MLLSKWSSGYTHTHLRTKCARSDSAAVGKQNESEYDAFPAGSFEKSRQQIDQEETSLLRGQAAKRETERQAFQARRQRLETEEVSMLRNRMLKRELPTIKDVALEDCLNKKKKQTKASRSGKCREYASAAAIFKG